MPTKQIKMTLRLDQDIHDFLATAAQVEGTSLNTFLNTALRKVIPAATAALVTNHINAAYERINNDKKLLLHLERLRAERFPCETLQ